MSSIYPARNGRWTAQVNTGGQRQSKTFDTKTEARRWARHTENAIEDNGKQKSAGTITFAELTEEYVAAIAETKNISRSKLDAMRLICTYIGRRPIRDLDATAFRDFARQRRNADTAPGPATIGMDFRYIHTILTHGGAITEINTEPALSALKAARVVLTAADAISSSGTRTRRPTDAELLQLRDFWAQRRRGIPMWQIVTFAVATAMRLSEITRIKWTDLNAEKKVIKIRDRKDPRKKAGNHQDVPLLCGPVTIGGETIDPLKIINSMPREASEIFPFNSATISTTFTRGVASCGIEDLRFHDLRHCGVSRLFEAGYTIEQVAMVSGHKDWNMLRRYTQLKPEALHRD